ncbi:teneurin-m-like [Tubulanus polymorphus]|uniref:teneurin-m-like n=1 Tax=Tubulanus polymorphus TaxID=672921 RepID=UPI003DA4A9B0
MNANRGQPQVRNGTNQSRHRLQHQQPQHLQKDKRHYSSSDGEDDPLTHRYDDRVKGYIDRNNETPQFTTREGINTARSLGLTTDESMISPLETGEPPMNRLYSYLSGSEGEGDGEPYEKGDNWEGRSHSVSSLSQSSLSDNEMHDCSNPHIGKMSTLPMPSIPPPPPDAPPPIDSSGRMYHPAMRGNYSEPEDQRRMCRPNESGSDMDPNYYTVHSSSGNMYTPSNVPQAPSFPRTVPKTNSLPHGNNRAINSGDMNNPIPPHQQQTHLSPHSTMDTRMPPEYESLNSLNRSDHKSDHYQQAPQQPLPQHLPPTERLQGQQYTYPSMVIPNPSVPVPSYSPVQNDFRHYSKFTNASYRVKKQIKQKCSWRCTGIILLLLLVVMAACLAYLTALSFLDRGTRRPITDDLNMTIIKLISKGANSPKGKPVQFELERYNERTLPPFSFWRSKLYMPRPNFVKFNFSVPGYAVIGVYGRKNLPPTHTQFDFFEVFDGKTIKDRYKREVGKTRYINPFKETAFIQFLEEGSWYVSIYNDGPDSNKVSFAGYIYDKIDTSCPNNCNGKGECIDDKCHCFPGYAGWECAQETCPVLCTGNGVYVRGACQCFSGWKGKECSTSADSCEVPNCNGNGVCEKGKCVCSPGFKGKDCEEVDCLMPNCSNHGMCIGGRCKCFKGWKGQDCETKEVQVVSTAVCHRNCSDHGQFDKESKKCVCDKGWTGSECEEEVCLLECVHGNCESRRCQCDEGWSGALCDQLTCDRRCYNHGFCDNGTCVCDLGWNGKHCSLDGCPNACNNHGTCQRFQDGWRCSCQSGWKGTACNVAMETQCGDSVDNDLDGLTDCVDPDCCVTFACKESIQCVTSPDPMEILLRKQPPSNTASFFDKMKFLIEDDSVQNYATRSSFNESQVSVIRGRVIAKDGSPLIGVRVSVLTQPLYGFTLTREQGLFDILVNGGGSVTLNFLRQPFKSKGSTVTVPWNRLITMDTVVMSLVEDKSTEIQPCPSANHDHYTVRPLVLSTWEHTQLGSCSSKSALIPESQVLQESILVPDTDVHLVYHSSETSGYMSTIMIQLTPDKIPETLAVVYMRIAVQGLTYEKTFEADAGLKYKFAWERLNAYNQKVYGIVTARVAVGYKYEDCDHIFWETQTATMSGYDMPSSDIGGWNLDIHHMYNYQEGILHKGDGTNIYLKEKPKKIVTVLGNGRRRKPECKNCNGPPEGNRLLAPVALASGLDGSLYVGDSNFIRKLLSSRQTVMNILQMGTVSSSYKYYMTVSPLNGKLYISDFQNHRVIRVKTMGAVRDLEHNYEVIAGTGETCVPGERDRCGDGSNSVNAKLLYPKGIAINKDGIVYFADGSNIRTVTKDNVIHTIIGHQEQPGAWRPLPCHEAISFEETTLKWPTALAVNPLDDTVHVLDNDMVLKLTHDSKVIVVAGRAIHCPPRNNQTRPNFLEDDELTQYATDVVLDHPQHIAFAPNGDLYIVESDKKYINRIRVVTTDGKIYHHVGAKPKCDCSQSNCRCFDPKEIVASQALLSNPTSVSVTPDSVLHISDMGNLRVHSVMSILPKQNAMRQYEVLSPETQELYIFNRYGQHLYSKNIITGQYMYNFTYSVNSFYGKLTSVRGAGNNQITIIRDYTTFAKEIRSPNGLICNLKMDNLARLVRFMNPDNFTVSFTYVQNTGLLETKHTSSGLTYFYTYDTNGRLTRAIQPTGEIISIETDVDTTGAVVHVKTDDKTDVTMATNGNMLSILHGAKAKITYTPDGSLVIEYPTEMAVTIETSPHPLLSSEHPIHLRRKIIMPQHIVHRLQWRYYIRRERTRVKRFDTFGRVMRVKRQASSSWHADSNIDALTDDLDMHEIGYNGKILMVKQPKRVLRINGENLLTIAYNVPENYETVHDKDKNEILKVIYNDAGQPTAFVPSTHFKPVNLSYSHHGAITGWKRGELMEMYLYDERSRLKQRQIGANAIYRYIYRGQNKPSDVILPSGKQYLLLYDNRGSLTQVITPGLGRHNFRTLSTMGYHRYIYTPPKLSSHFINDYNGHGKLINVFYPSQMRRVLYRYDDQSRLYKVIFDQSDVVHNYDNAGNMAHINLTNRQQQYNSQVEYKPMSSLVKEQIVKLEQANSKFLSGRFIYQYDRNFRVISLESQIGTHHFRPVNSTYSNNNGRLEKIKSFNFNYPAADKQIIRDINVEISRAFDAYGRLDDMRYKFNNRVVYTLQLTYDKRNRIHKWRRRIGDTDTRTFEYEYDIDNNVVNVKIDHVSSWKYSYDANSNLKSITQGGHTMQIAFNARNQIVSLGQTGYKFDKDGFLIQRGKEKFAYNSLAQITQAKKPGEYEIWYYYDGLGRLIARKADATNIMQYYYGDVMHRDRITHTYNHQKNEITLMFYDSSGRLFSMERDNSFYYVAKDPMGSTLVIYNSVGQAMKTVTYSPFGLIQSDTKPTFDFPFGFQGGVYDPETNLIFLGHRLYDPMTGRWTTPDYKNLFDLPEKMTLTPEVMNFYQFRHPMNTHWKESDQYLRDMGNWMKLLGYDLESLVPSVSFNGKIRDPVITQGIADFLPSISAFECAFERDVIDFTALSAVPRSKVTPKIHPQVSKTFGPYSPIFGEGVVLSSVGTQVIVNFLDSARDKSKQLAAVLLNNSYTVDLQFTINGKDVHYFIKEDLEQADVDLDELGIVDTAVTLPNGINVSVHRGQVRRRRDPQPRYVDIRLHGNHTVLNIRYGTTLEKERHRVLVHAKERAVEHAWIREKHILVDDMHSVHKWRKVEKEQLLSTGEISGYKGEYIRDVDVYPELADDPQNIVFVPVS